MSIFTSVYLTSWRRTWQIASTRHARCVRSCALCRLRRCPSPPSPNWKGRPNNRISEDTSIAFVTAVATGVGWGMCVLDGVKRPPRPHCISVSCRTSLAAPLLLACSLDEWRHERKHARTDVALGCSLSHLCHCISPPFMCVLSYLILESCASPRPFCRFATPVINTDALSLLFSLYCSLDVGTYRDTLSHDLNASTNTIESQQLQQRR